MTAEVQRFLNGLDKEFLRVAARIDDHCERNGAVDEMSSFVVDGDLRAVTVVASSPMISLTYYVVPREGRLPVVNYLTVVTSAASHVSEAEARTAIKVMKRVRSDGDRSGDH